MVKYIRSDLEFILKQIKISEDHALHVQTNGAEGKPLFGTPDASIPAYNISWGLRTVDGSYNHLLPGQEKWGASDTPFNELMNPTYRTITMMMDPDGAGPAPTMPVSMPYTPGNDVDGNGTFANPGDVIDPSLRTISNLIVDQTLSNPIAIMVGLERAGVATDVVATATQIHTAFKAIAPLFAAQNTAEVNKANAQAAFNANPSPENQAALDDANAALSTAQANLLDARGALDTLLEANGIEMDGANVLIANAAPDEGLSAPFNSWFTLFGQFFDHGLDLVNKGGSGTVMIPLQPDDPLYVPGSPTNFMVLTRATTTAGPDGQWNTADDVRPINTTTAYVDQNQTYTSHPSHQVFLREYMMTPDGPVSTGKLIEGANGGMANWGEVKAQALNMLGITLTDLDVGTVPLLRTDAYGNFIPGPGGYPQVVVGLGADGIPNTNDDVVVSGTPDAPVSLTNAIRTNSAFLADIAHFAVPDGLADGDTEVGGNIPEDGFYDNELLDAHFIAGDGRANENIGLTAVHHVFHSEHNRLVQHTKETVLASGDLAFINEWLATDITTLPTTPAQIAALVWDGERVFQAAKFGTEMQYQHLVFEEFARKVQPNINVFLVPDGFDTMMDPSIFAEFAHVVYRFGHSMLNESIDQFDPQFNADHISLIQGFLNPAAFDGPNGESDHDLAAGAIIRGMTRQVGNEIDEFVTGALRNNLLGLPLDLATINLARGRDTGVPSLNEARRTFFEMTNQDALLTPYSSWVDFAGNLKHEASIINFVAAYGTHSLITDESTVEGKRDAAMTLIFGVPTGKFADQAGFIMPTDAEAFLNGTSAYAANLGGLENVDLWIGGLAEKIMPFGGMLGSTFNFVFEAQMELLQSGDRFYYLQRLDGLHLFGEMENNSFAAMMMRNTDATHLPSDVFSTPGLILEIDRKQQYNPGLGEDPGADGVLEDNPDTAVDESADNVGMDPTGGGILTPLVIRNNPATPGTDTNYLRYTGGDHVVLGGTNANDILVASIGDDTLYGDGGNDVVEGGFGNDIINAGDGDDIIKDMGGDDNIKAGEGNDVVHAGPGLDLVMGNDGQDFIFLGTDMGSEVFAGQGDDFIYGNRNAERILGNEGNDWIETGTFDGAPGDNFDEVFAHDEIDGHDVFLGDGGFDEFIGEGGDDIMVGSTGRGKMAGMSGFDWATYKDSTFGVNADLSRPIVFDESPTLPQNAALDEYASMEGLSGSKYNDVLGGSNAIAEERLPAAQGGTEGYRGSQVTKESIQLIAGLAEVLGLTTAQVNAMAAGQVVFSAGDIILGGDGSDVISGNGGDDVIDGDKWLDVQIAVYATTERTGTPTAYYNSMKDLAAKMFSGEINPGQLGIVRTIKTDMSTGDVDVAKFQGERGEYAFSATADGQVIVSHAIENSLDGTDQLRNIEKVQFATGNALNIIVGTPYSDNGMAIQGAPPLNQPALNGTADDDLILGLAGSDVLNGFGGNDILVGGASGAVSTPTMTTYVDNFESSSLNNSNGSAGWTSSWVETGDNGNTNSASAGQIRIDSGTPANTLVFRDDDTDPGNGTATIQRTVNLTGVLSATISYSFNEVSFDAGETVTVTFAADGVNFNQTIQTIDGNSGSGNISNVALTGPFTANSAIRFVVNGTNANSGTTNPGDYVSIDSLVISRTTATVSTAGDTLNGGLGDDTYSFAVGDGNDVINEAVSATSGGVADRISILAPSTGTDVDGLPTLTLNSLSMSDNDTDSNDGELIISYGLPSDAQTVTQTITVNEQFNGTNAQTGVERINFNGAVYAGYALGSEDYLISRDDGSANLSASTANNVIVGEDGGSDDTIIGGAGNDLIFGGTGDNLLTGGDGDDLLVGGSGADDDDSIDGGLGADTMIGLAGDDTYVVDDLFDVVVEAAGAGTGTDVVETTMAALSIELMANVENLTYTGIDADQFVGTGNILANTISGGDLNDTLSGLAGNDTLIGGLGADTMIGGDGNDVYFVEDAGDVVTEATADTLVGGTDRVESEISITLGANVENLDLNGTAVTGTGNALNNVINGNGSDNQLFGGGGNDSIDGGNGSDLVDGGTGDDGLSGGAGGDTDTIIGGDGNDTINVSDGNDVILYNAVNFGADIVTGFDATATGGQDLINLSALGITATDLATRVIETQVGANTLLTVRDASLATIGTIQINGVTNAAIDATDYILATSPTGAPINGTPGANTLNGTVNADTINGLGGNDTLNGLANNDVLNGGEGTDTLNGGDGNDTLTGGAGSDTGNYADNFGTAAFTNSDGSVAFTGSWTEGGETTSATGGDITVNGGRLQFNQNIDGGETIERALNLAGATAASVSFAYEDDNLGAGQSVIVQARNVVTNEWETLTGGTLGSTTGNGNGTFNATLSANQIGANSAIRFLTTGDGNNWDNGDNFYVDNFSVTLTTPGLNAGADTINGDAGDDTIIWNANAAAPTDGRDVVNGGTEGTAGDTFVINGNASGEFFRIYTKAAAATAGIASAAATEIVVTRALAADGPYEVIAELSEIEEIRINGVDPSGTGGPVGAGDNVAVIGDFSSTNLRLNTVTVNGGTGNDSVDVSQLTSDHRIVLNSGGGDDSIIGAVRPQDVLNIDDVLSGTRWADIIYGGDGNDTISGNKGNDILLGGSGVDRLIGNSGANSMTGGLGSDRYYVGNAADQVFESAGGGKDVVYSSVSFTLAAEQAIEMLSANAGSTGLSLTGNELNNTINGGAGGDTLSGGGGIDQLIGGGGSDIYRFLSATDADKDIVTFEAGDRLDFSSMDAGGPGASFTLVTGSSFTNLGQLRVIEESGYVIVEGNVSGDSAADFRLTVKGVNSLSADDFDL